MFLINDYIIILITIIKLFSLYALRGRTGVQHNNYPTGCFNGMIAKHGVVITSVDGVMNKDLNKFLKEVSII